MSINLKGKVKMLQILAEGNLFLESLQEGINNLANKEEMFIGTDINLGLEENYSLMYTFYKPYLKMDEQDRLDTILSIESNYLFNFINKDFSHESYENLAKHNIPIEITVVGKNTMYNEKNVLFTITIVNTNMVYAKERLDEYTLNINYLDVDWETL